MENTCTPNIKSSYTYEDLLASGRGELLVKKARNFQHQRC